MSNIDFFIPGIQTIFPDESVTTGQLSLEAIAIFLSINISLSFLLPPKPLTLILSPIFLVLTIKGKLISALFNLHILLLLSRFLLSV